MIQYYVKLERYLQGITVKRNELSGTFVSL